MLETRNGANTHQNAEKIRITRVRPLWRECQERRRIAISDLLALDSSIPLIRLAERTRDLTPSLSQARTEASVYVP
jgi:hypothetical protein